MYSKSLVSIVKGKDPIEITKKSVDLIGGINKFIRKKDSILIKPNLVVPLPTETGVTTNPLVIKAIIELCKENGNEKIVVGDSPFFPFSARNCFKATRLIEIIEELNVEMAYFDEEKYTPVDNPNAKIFKKINLPESIIKCDSIISIPRLKCHSQTLVSLSIKNQIGVLSPEDKKLFHRDDLHQKIIDCNLGLQKKLKLAVMDATFGLEGQGPTFGNPVKMELVLASNDFLALDRVSCEVMDHDVNSIPHLLLASRNNLGKINSEEIKIIGEKFEDVRMKLKKASQDIIGVFPNVHVHVGAACKIGCHAWARVAIDSLIKKGELDKCGDISFIMGMKASITNELIGKVFVIGDCASEFQEKGTFIAGCPPFMTYKVIPEQVMKSKDDEKK